MEGVKHRLRRQRQGDLLKRGRLQAELLLQLRQRIALRQKLLVADALRQLCPVPFERAVSRVLEEIPEVLPGDKAARQVPVAPSRLVQAFHIVQPSLPQGVVIEHGGKAGGIHSVSAQIPGVAHPQEYPKPLLSGRPEHPIQLVVGVALVPDLSRPVHGLKFVPGHRHHDAVKAVGGDPGQFFLHVNALAVPEIDHPVIGIVGGRPPVFRFLSHLCPGGGSRQDRQKGGCQNGCQLSPSVSHACPLSFRPSSLHTVSSMVA